MLSVWHEIGGLKNENERTQTDRAKDEIKMDQFKTTVFGGFDKKDVVSSIEQLVKKYEERIVEAEQKLAEQEQEKQEREKNLKQAILQIQSLKKRIHTNEENYQQVLEAKNQRLDENELLNRQLDFKIKALEERVSKYSGLNLEARTYMQRTEKLAKEKTNQLILQAKDQIEKEYRSRMENAAEESKAILAQAQEKADRIMKHVSKQSRELLEETRKDAEVILETAQRQAQTMIDEADCTAKKLLNQAVDSMLPKADFPNKETEEAQKQVIFRLEQLQQSIEKMRQTVNQLDNTGVSVKKAKGNSEGVKVSVTSMGDDSSRRYKNALKNYFKREKE